jgi:hypothetical protein
MRELSRERELRAAAERDTRLWGLLRGLEAAEARAEREADARARGRRRERERERQFARLRHGFELLRAAYSEGEC